MEQWVRLRERMVRWPAVLSYFCPFSLPITHPHYRVKMLRLVFKGESGGERTVGGGEAVVREVGAGFGDGEDAVGGHDDRAVLRKILRWRRRGKGKEGRSSSLFRRSGASLCKVNDDVWCVGGGKNRLGGLCRPVGALGADLPYLHSPQVRVHIGRYSVSQRTSQRLCRRCARSMMYDGARDRLRGLYRPVGAHDVVVNYHPSTHHRSGCTWILVEIPCLNGRHGGYIGNVEGQ